MTRKTYLGLSEVINFCVFAFLALTTYLTYHAVNLGKYYPPIVYSIPEISYVSRLGVLAIATIFALIALVAKGAARKIERNRMTLLCILLDAVILAFFLFTARDAIPKVLTGNFTDSLTEVITVAASAVAILLDVFSMPAERWGYSF